MLRIETYLEFALLAGIALSAPPAACGELPTGGTVAHGSVGISRPAPKRLAIKQSSQNAIVNWKGFSIGRGARVDIDQPSTSSTILNRVTGSTPSTIAGRLNANGQVYLVNPNGIAITKTGTVRTSAFAASTLGISDEDFEAGRRVFAGNGRSAGIAHEGVIEIGRGGYAALIGGRVENSGVISVPMGKVGLGAGEQATLDLSGDGFLQVTVPSGQAPGEDDALIRDTGRITADGGRVEIKAATARHAARQAINLSGVIEARSVGGRSGAIVLGGGDGGRVTVSGKLDVSAPGGRRAAVLVSEAPRPRPREVGGAVAVTGDTIRLAGATIDASGANGGGTVRIGGDLRGRGALPRASTTSVDSATVINADAVLSGDGGSVVVWSDHRTRFDGRVTARGGAAGGDGGFAEVSGKALLAYSGGADLSAPAGDFGTLLLDPYNVFITDDPTTGDLVGEEDITFIPAGDDSVLNAADLVDALGTANVTVTTEGDGEGGQAGDITVAAGLSWDTGGTLTLTALGDIILQNAITAPVGGLTLAAAGGITTPGPLGAVDVGIFTLGSGDWVQNAASLPGFATDDFRIEEGSFLRAAGGDGTTTAPYLIADVYGLQGIGSSEAFLASSYALTNDVDASGTAGWNDFEGALGFDPIGLVGEFTGAFDGQGNEIDGLFINLPGVIEVGLFGFSRGASISSVGLTNVNVTGGAATGALVGNSTEGGIAKVFVTGEVTGSGYGVGGLVGINTFAEISDAYSLASVFWTGSVDTCCLVAAGGLVGANWGGISRSHAAGAVTATASSDTAGATLLVGGLVGSNTNAGTITQSYATGEVIANGSGLTAVSAGGLAGSNEFDSTISQSYATGVVIASDDIGSPFPAGGLVGLRENEDLVTASYWDTETSGQPTSGGGTGLTTAEFQDTEGFIALAGAEGWNFETTWAPPSPGDPGFYPELYALTPVVRVDVDDASRLYGAPDPVFTSSNFGGPDVFAFGPPGDSLTIPLTTSATLTGDVGSYPITAGVSATSAAGVTFRLVTTDGTLTVDPASATVTADDQSKFYGTALTFAGTEFTTDGLLFGDAVASVALTSAGAPAPATVAGSPYAILASDALGEGLSNYAITYVPGALTVDPASLNVTVTADDLSKTYGTALTFAGTEFTTDGLLFDDAVTSVTLTSAGAPATATVAGSPYAISASDAQGDGLSNYAITYVPGTLLVTPAPLTITADDLVKFEGTTLTFSGTEFSARGLVNDDQVTSVTLASDGAPATATVSGSPYDILASAAQGTELSNYDIAYETGALTVIPPRDIPSDNLVPLIPAVELRLPNPPDVIEIVLETDSGFEAASGGGPSLGTGEGTTATAEETLAFVTQISGGLELRADACERSRPDTDEYLVCIGTALDRYARELDARVLELPEPLRAVSAVIHETTRGIETARAVATNRLRTARSDEESLAIEREAVAAARDSVRDAVAEIRKAIELIRADEPRVASLQTEQGNAITTALQTVEAGLSKAIGL